MQRHSAIMHIETDIVTDYQIQLKLTVFIRYYWARLRKTTIRNVAIVQRNYE